VCTGYRHLTREERCHIHGLLKSGLLIREIARDLGRDRSAVSREVRRNSSLPGGGTVPARPSVWWTLPLGRLLRSLKDDGGKVAQGPGCVAGGWNPDRISGRACPLQR